MVDITFTQADGGSTAVTVSASVIYGTDWWPKRLNQLEDTTADGTDVVVDNGPTQIIGEIFMRGVSFSDGNDFRDWITDTIVFAKNRFTISAVANLNLGLGVNTAISVAGGATTNPRYNGGNSLKGIFNLVAPQNYDITFPYRFLV